MRYPDEATKEKVRALRRRATPAEDALWGAVRDQRVAGLKFRRQHLIGAFVVEFCCTSHHLVVELGRIRCRTDEQLAAHGYTVLRFRNDEVLHRLPYVIERITESAARTTIAKNHQVGKTFELEQ